MRQSQPDEEHGGQQRRHPASQRLPRRHQRQPSSPPGRELERLPPGRQERRRPVGGALSHARVREVEAQAGDPAPDQPLRDTVEEGGVCVAAGTVETCLRLAEALSQG